MLPVKVISLPRSAARREAFSRANSHLDFEFSDAVDGSAMSAGQIAASGLFEPGLPYSVGAYGIALSHLAQWERIIQSGQPHTVAEDDAVFRHDFRDRQARALAALPPDWDFILWGWNFDSVLVTSTLPGLAPMVVLSDQQQLRGALSRFQSVTAPPQPMRLNIAFGLPCYSMSPAGARKFKSSCFPLANFDMMFAGLGHRLGNTGIDVAMCRVYSSLNAFVSLPPLVATPNDHTVSTVQNNVYFP